MDCGVCDKHVYDSVALQHSSISLCCDDEITNVVNSDDMDVACSIRDESIGIVNIEDDNVDVVPSALYSGGSAHRISSFSCPTT